MNVLLFFNANRIRKKTFRTERKGHENIRQAKVFAQRLSKVIHI